MSIVLPLPALGGHLSPYTLSTAAHFPDRVTRPLNRVALAAAHVVASWLAFQRPISCAPNSTATSALPRRAMVAAQCALRAVLRARL